MERATSIEDVRDYVQMWERIYRRAIDKKTEFDPAAEECLWVVEKILKFINEGERK